MKRISGLLFPVFCIILLTGCGGSFLAASISRGTDGGVYRVRQGQGEQLLNIPSLNFLWHDPESGLYYGTSNHDFRPKGKSGSAVILRYTASGKMELVRTVPVEGKTPCFLSLSPDRRFLYTANYSSGDLSEIPLENGLFSGPPRLIRHSGHGSAKRQRAPHPHCAVFEPSGKRLYVCDLGTDHIWIYDWSPETGLQLPCAEKLALPPGSGPRHLVFDPSGRILYAANELNSTAASFVRDPSTGKWRLHTVRSTLIQPVPRNFPGAVKITADGRFFFVANRGHDSIAVFETSGDGGFRLLAAVPSQRQFPSDLLLQDHDRILSVIHLKSGTVNRFRFDSEQKKLIPVSGQAGVPQGIGLCP